MTVIQPQASAGWTNRKWLWLLLIFILVLAALGVCGWYLFGNTGSAQTRPTPPATTTPAPAPKPAAPKAQVKPVKTPDAIRIDEQPSGTLDITINWPTGVTPSKRDEDYWKRCLQPGGQCGVKK